MGFQRALRLFLASSEKFPEFSDLLVTLYSHEQCYFKTTIQLLLLMLA